MPRKAKARPALPAEVDAIRHHDARANIPTNELKEFAGDHEANPPAIRYPRDPSLDPQLVWQGKDAQDADDLVVRAAPIYIQEKIQPQAIIEQVRKAAACLPSPRLRGRGAGGEGAEVQLDLFSDFNGIEFDDLIEFYQHQQHWSNRMILGDSLNVMASLAEKEGLKGKVQMIYLDPPYGIKFGSNWQASTRKRDVKDGKAEDLTMQPEQVRAFRDTWELGIHSYLSYLRDRLTVARDLLTDSGSIFVQIGDENVHLVRSLLDEVFGSENFISQITFRKKNMPFGAHFIEGMVDYLLWYAKDTNLAKYRALFTEKDVEGASRWNLFEAPDGVIRMMSAEQFQDHSLLPKGSRLLRHGFLKPSGVNASGLFSFRFKSKIYPPPQGGSWATTEKGMLRLAQSNRIGVERNNLGYRQYHDDYPVSRIHNFWTDTSGASDKVYVVQTMSKVIERCLLMTTDPGDLVLDPTCGSGTTAYVAEQWGRRWITIDTSRVALALARARLMSAKYPYYLLADSPEGAEKAGVVPGTEFGEAKPRFGQDVRQGFVYERVPHITLRDIANNDQIDVIYEAFEQQLAPLRAEIDAALGCGTEEWHLPLVSPSRSLERGPGGEVGIGEGPGVRALLDRYAELRRERQRLIDDSIQASAAYETLYDRPFEDRKRVRVAGPFTVESQSPHRLLDPDAAGQRAAPALNADFASVVLEKLRAGGVANTRKGQRLTFDTLEPFAGAWIQARGSYTDAEGESRSVAVSIGGEHGTITAAAVQSAAKEAVKGVGHDLLLVVGLAFDGYSGEERKRYGALDVQLVRASQDLTMGLKDSARDSLFTIVGEPDIAIETTPDGQIVVRVLGMDIYDPTTGEIRSAGRDPAFDVAAWFVDTGYDETSFFVRHAYFPGNEALYDSLKKALRADVDEGAWATLNSLHSTPFERPESGKIAVKVINHYGDEVVKVYEV